MRRLPAAHRALVLRCRSPIVGNALMFAMAALPSALKPFLGALRRRPKHAHEAPVLLMARAGGAGRRRPGLAGFRAGSTASALISSPMASAIDARVAGRSRISA